MRSLYRLFVFVSSTTGVVLVGVALAATILFGGPTAARADYSTEVIADGARGYWQLDDLAGQATAVNSGAAGAALNGTYTPGNKVDASGLVFGVTGPSDAANFNPGDSVIGTGVSTATSGGGTLFGGDWTIEGWFKRETPIAVAGFFSADQVSAPIFTFHTADTSLIGIMNNGVSWGGLFIDLDEGKAADFHLNQQVYAVMTKTGTNIDPVISIRANVGGTWVTPVIDSDPGFDLALADTFTIGRHDMGFPGGYFDGTLDDVALYDKALSWETIEAHYALGATEPSPPIITTPESGLSITWDGNEGLFFDPEAPPLQVGAPDNAALAVNGATAFGSSEYGFVVHQISNVNDGYYGNSNSWLGSLTAGVDPAPFIGIDFAGTEPLSIESIAFGRDNGNIAWNGVDRWRGEYALQYTLLADPDKFTLDTGNPDTGWANVGTIDLNRFGLEGESMQEPWLRHVYDLAAEGKGPILATGIRILTPYGNAIDELEVNPIPEPSTVVLLAIGGLSLILCRLRRRRA